MSDSQAKSSGKPNTNPYPMIAPRFWHGMPSHIWWPLLAKNRFRFSWQRAQFILSVGLLSPFNDLMSLLQHAIHGRKISQTKLAGPPVFVIGHWRSGTTLMHELLDLDGRFTSPNTYQCFAPWHFLLTEGLMNRFGNWLLPEKRPMDNMKVGWKLPQEDEFALMILGAPTPYFRIAFPKQPAPYMDSLGSKTFNSDDLARWKKTIDWFFKALTYHTGKPLIVKSPPHTGRLAILAEMYPDAKFIHMVRDPRKLYPSTMKLWRVLDEIQSLQSGEDEASLHDFVIQSLHRMYDSFELDRKKLSSDRIIDVHYEELVKAPVDTVEKIYRHLKLGDSTDVLEKIRIRSEAEREYKTNEHSTNPEMEQMILREWHDYAIKYGYVQKESLQPSAT